MLSFFSWAKVKRFLFIGFTLLTLTAILSGCNSDPDSSGNLNGTWDDGYATMTINTSTKKVEYENNYHGDIVNSPNYKNAYGIIIVKFTKYWEGDFSNYPDVTYTETGSGNGKFGAIYWKELNDKTVLISDAYLSGIHTMFATLEEAKAEFTWDKEGNYAFWSLPRTKVK